MLPLIIVAQDRKREINFRMSAAFQLGFAINHLFRVPLTAASSFYSLGTVGHGERLSKTYELFPESRRNLCHRRKRHEIQ